MMRKARQHMSRAHIGEETDDRLGHGEQIAVAGHAIGAMHRDSDAAAHADAVDQRHEWLRERRDAQVEAILVAPEVELRGVVAGSSEIMHQPDVAAGTEGPVARAVDDDAFDRRVSLEPVQRLGHGRDHRGCQSIERTRPVESDEPGRPASLALNLALRHVRRHRPLGRAGQCG